MVPVRLRPARRDFSDRARGSVAHASSRVAQRLPPTPASATPSRAECLLERLEQHQNFPSPSSQTFSLVSITIEFHILVFASCIHIAFAGRTTLNLAFAGARCPSGVFWSCWGYFLSSDNFLFPTSQFFQDWNFLAFQRGGWKTHERLGMTQWKSTTNDWGLPRIEREGQMPGFQRFLCSLNYLF